MLPTPHWERKPLCVKGLKGQRGWTVTERRTSAAKDILTPDTERLLEQYGVVSEKFERAHDGPEPERDDREDHSGSSMVENDQPKPELRPPPEIANDVDRESFNERWFDEQRAADERAEAREDGQDREMDREP